MLRGTEAGLLELADPLMNELGPLGTARLGQALGEFLEPPFETLTKVLADADLFLFASRRMAIEPDFARRFVEHLLDPDRFTADRRHGGLAHRGDAGPFAADDQIAMALLA